ncbi:MAG: hypothetical protein OQK73_12165 [Gammaproteobacteria bacterium]|nr:hypothetical protein [Gammaproteobacteria bacterium]
MKPCLYRSLNISLLIGLIAQFYYFSVLPDAVANHFGNDGHANGWMSNTANLIFSIVILVVNTLVFLSTETIFRKVPIKYISFPKKEYWLAPERKESSIELMTSWMLFFGVATNIFLILVLHLVYRANMNTPPKLDEDSSFIVMVLYIAIMAGWLIKLYRRFNKTA